MAKYLIDNVGDFFRQSAYTPLDTLELQIVSAENLLHEIDSSRAYPLDYVVFRITGYQRRFRESGFRQPLLTGLALLHDLGLLIEQLSDRLQLVSASMAEPVLSIDDVTEQFNVTSKTVQRWRRRGLPARRFQFADGKRRVGFLLNSVERFVRAHREQVLSDHPNISLVESVEHERMLRAARRLASDTGCWPEEIARRIGGRFNRSPLTVLHTIRAFDLANPSNAIFAAAAKPPGEVLRSRLLRRYAKGWSLDRLARRSGKSRYVVYRVVMDARVEKMRSRKISFVDDPLYHHADAESTMAAIREGHSLVPVESDLAALSRPALMRGISAELQYLCRTPLLTASQERGLFLELNFCKFQFAQARRRLDPQFARQRDLGAMENLLVRISDVRNRIVMANMRLVVSIARKHQRGSACLMDLVSDGNLTMMRAVDGFDIHRGNRFSTYATFALMKGFARSVSQLSTVLRPLGRLGDKFTDSRIEKSESVAVSDEVATLLARLTKSERAVIGFCYGLDRAVDGDDRILPESTRQIADALKLTPPRLREIEQRAIAKMRSASR